MEIPLEPIFAAFGLAADVTTPDAESPITTTVVWSSVETDDVPGGSAFQRREPLRVAGLKRSEVPTVPRGTLIVAPEVLGGAVKTWRVDGTDRVDVDMVRVIVMQVEDET